MKSAILTALIGFLLIVSQIFYANKEKFLTVSQMILERRLKQGIPLITHAGVWGDLLIITPILTWIVYAYGDLWNQRGIFISLIIGMAITFFMVAFWVNLTKYGLGEALAYHGRLTTAGLFHGLYMAGAITIFLLFFFYSGASRQAAAIVAVFLACHIFYSTHIILGLIAPDWYPDRPHKQISTWAIISISWGLLAWRCLTIR